MRKLKAYLMFALAFVFFSLSFVILLTPSEESSLKLVQRNSYYAEQFRNLLVARMGTGAMRKLNL